MMHNRRRYNSHRLSNRMNESFFDDYFTEYRTLDNYTELCDYDTSHQPLSIPTLDDTYNEEPSVYQRNYPLNHKNYNHDPDNKFKKPEANVLDTFYKGSDDQNISKSQKLLESCNKIMNSDKKNRNYNRSIRRNRFE